MADGWIRQLDSKLWANTVHTPAGRITETFDLKGQARNWGREITSSIKRGDFIDPRLSKMSLGEWRERCDGARRIEKATRLAENSAWKNHTGPQWAGTPIGAVLKPDVQKWINKMEAEGVGPPTIHAAVNVLRGLFEQAIDARMLRFNPGHRVKLPPLPAHVDRVILPAEETLIIASLNAKFDGRPEAALFVLVLLGLGLRWEEAAALWRNQVDMRRKLVHIGPVMERDGTRRLYPKSPAGVRAVPVGPTLWPLLRDLALTRKPEEYLFLNPDRWVAQQRPAKFTGPMPATHFPGTPLNYHNWLKRIWNPGLVEIERGKHGKIVSRTPIVEDVQPTPHDCRHTYGTRLAEQGVPEHEIAALMGHSPKSHATRRYIHAGEVRFDRARDALEKARDSQATHDLG